MRTFWRRNRAQGRTDPGSADIPWLSWLLRALALLLLLGGVVLVARSFENGGQPRVGSSYPAPIEPPGVFLNDRDHWDSTVEVGLSFVHLHRDSLKLDTVARLHFPNSILERIIDIDTGRALLSRRDGRWVSDQAMYPRAIAVRISNLGGETFYVARVRIGTLLSGTSPEPGKVTNDSAFSIVLAGDPSAYPGDEYAMTGAVTLQLPRPLVFRTNSDASSSYLPASLMVRSDPSLRGEDVNVAGSTTQNGTAFSLQLRTSRDNRLFSYFMVAAPLGLVVLALVVMLRAVPTGEWESVLALSLGLFAIIPIRQVVVPTDIGSVTRLDKFLALDVVSVVAVGFFITAHAVAKQHRSAPVEPLN